MTLLLNSTDIRDYRQIGKQINADNFNGRVREIQDNQLTELLGEALSYDFFSYLENNWLTQIGTLTRVSDYIFQVDGVNLTDWATFDYGIMINNNEWYNVKSVSFDGSNSLIEVYYRELPTTLTTLKYKIDSYYIRLLNGATYLDNNKTIKYNGLRAFLAWHWMVSYLLDGGLKQSDVGNINITGELFQKPTISQVNEVRSGYLENASRESNRIKNYLNNNRTTFELWDVKPEKSIIDFNYIVI